MSPKKDSSKAATKAAAKPIKKEPTMVDDTRKQTSNMLTQLKNGQHKDEEKKALLQYYQNLDRFSVQKKELLQLWAKDRTCKWFASWNKTVCQTEETNVQGRMGYGTRHLQHVTSQYMFFQYMFVWLIVQPCRFQLAAMLEMPEDSAPFKAVEQSMEKQGLADTKWDETDPVQKAYSLAKLKRWDLSKVHATFTSTSFNSKWEESLAASKEGNSKAQLASLSSMLEGSISSSSMQAQGGQSSNAETKHASYKNLCVMLSSPKSILAALVQ